MAQKFCLKWNNHMNVMDEFKHFLSIGIMVDVTLACDGKSLKAHKIVLSACSPFFRSLFLENPCKHPIVILKDVKYTELKAIIDFMYHGEVNVAEDELSVLMKTAQTLRVKGLGEELSECLKNDHSNYESENQSGDESENQSEDELSNLSVCTVDVSNEAFRKKRPVTDQNENYELEIKREVLSDDTYQSAVTIPLFSDPHNSNFFDSQQEQLVEQNNNKCAVEENFQDSMQNLVRQSDSFPGQSFESSLQSNMQQHQNCTDNPSSSIPATPTCVSSNTTVDNQELGTSSVSSHESLQKKEKLEKIPTKKSPEKITFRKSLRQQHNLRQSGVNGYDDSNSRKVVDEDSGIPISKRKLHKCSICSFKSLYESNLKRHYRTTAHDEAGQFQCNECTYATASKSQLVHHIESIHQKEKPYHCSLCTYKAARRDTLKKHIKSIHEAKKRLKCEKCDYHTAKKGNLKRHITIHGKRKEFECPDCSFRSHRRDSLNGHLKIHTKKK